MCSTTVLQPLLPILDTGKCFRFSILSLLNTRCCRPCVVYQYDVTLRSYRMGPVKEGLLIMVIFHQSCQQLQTSSKLKPNYFLLSSRSNVVRLNYRHDALIQLDSSFFLSQKLNESGKQYFNAQQR